MKLYEINEAYQNLMSLDIEDDALELALSSIQDTLADKADNIAALMRTIEAENNAYKAEIERFNNLKKSNEHRLSTLKEYLSKNLLDMDIKKLNTGRFKIGFRKSVSVNITDEKKLSAKYLKEKTTISADKTALKNDLKSGVKIDGAELVERQNIQIK